MAFRRKSRKTIELEFITEKEEKIIFEVAYTKKLGEKLVKLAEEMSDEENMSEEEQSAYLIKAYDEMLGAGAMDKIQEEVFGGDDLLLSDLVDIGLYITSVVEKKNKEIEDEYQLPIQANPANPVVNNPVNNNANQRLFTIEEVQRLLNENTNKLPN